MRVNADETINPAVGAAHFFDQLIFSGLVSQLQKELCTPRFVTCRGREPNGVANHLENGYVWCVADRD